MGTNTTKCCVFCGGIDSLTVDHVPPKAIFAKPRPNNLITVPSCNTCNGGSAKDDEYFRMRLCLNDQVRGHPAVNAHLPTIFKSLHREEASGLKASLLSDRRTVEITSEGGVYLGQRAGLNVDLERICRVVGRTVRGLYYHETGSRLPTGYDVLTITDEMLCDHGQEVIDDTINNFLIPFGNIPEKVFGEQVFAYRHALMPEPFASAWLLTFYGSVAFLCLTGPIQAA